MFQELSVWNKFTIVSLIGILLFKVLFSLRYQCIEVLNVVYYLEAMKRVAYDVEELIIFVQIRQENGLRLIWFKITRAKNIFNGMFATSLACFTHRIVSH